MCRGSVLCRLLCIPGGLAEHVSMLLFLGHVSRIAEESLVQWRFGFGLSSKVVVAERISPDLSFVNTLVELHTTREKSKGHSLWLNKPQKCAKIDF